MIASSARIGFVPSLSTAAIDAAPTSAAVLHHHLADLISKASLYYRHMTHLAQGGFRVAAAGGMRNAKSDTSARSRTRGSSSVRSAQPLLIHYHIFKNAGTSFEWALERAFGERYTALDKESPRGFVAEHDFAQLVRLRPEVSAIASHQAAPPPPRLRGRQVFTSILIRDPLARVRSIYAFERGQQAKSPGAVKAKELDFKGYVEWRLKTAPAMFCNYQVHFCTRRDGPLRSRLGPEDLQQAIANLDAVSIVGTVGRYAEWLGVAQKVLARAFPDLVLQATQQNVTAKSAGSKAAILDQLIDELGDSIVQHLLENNELDMCLYQVADSILTRKLAEEGVQLHLMHAYVQAQHARGPVPVPLTLPTS